MRANSSWWVPTPAIGGRDTRRKSISLTMSHVLPPPEQQQIVERNPRAVAIHVQRTTSRWIKRQSFQRLRNSTILNPCFPATAIFRISFSCKRKFRADGQDPSEQTLRPLRKRPDKQREIDRNSFLLSGVPCLLYSDLSPRGTSPWSAFYLRRTLRLPLTFDHVDIFLIALISFPFTSLPNCEVPIHSMLPILFLVVNHGVTDSVAKSMGTSHLARNGWNEYFYLYVYIYIYAKR